MKVYIKPTTDWAIIEVEQIIAESTLTKKDQVVTTPQLSKGRHDVAAESSSDVEAADDFGDLW